MPILLLLWSLASATFAGTPVILVLGDSLSAAHGLVPERGWVALLSQRLERVGLPHRVVNASASGETSDGGRLRLPALLRRHRPQVLILELGANDGLRGLPLPRLADNLAAMVQVSREAGARVLLLAARLPPNYGPYAEAFHDLYRHLGRRLGVPVVDFLGAFGARRELFQSDGLHPTAAAQPLILDAVWPALVPLLAPAASEPLPSLPRRPGDGPSGSSPAAGSG